MDVGVLVLVVVNDSVDDGARLLRRGAVVEVNEGLAVNGRGEDREVGADALDIERPGPLSLWERARVRGLGTN
jgi:hypothetical protein